MHLMEVFSSPQLVNCEPLTNQLRRVKSPDELAVMEQACKIADDAMAAVTQKVAPGVTMNDLVEEVEHQLRIHGSRTPSFETHIFAVGPDGTLESRNETGNRPLKHGYSVLFDFGAVVDGYCSDFGRTIYLGEPTPEYERAYRAILAAQEAGRAAAKPGATAAEVNRACRAPIEEDGYGPYFRHRMGHGIGLDVHEHPFISEEDHTSLQVGMTFTDEPSIVWQDTVGVRIEDIVVCEEGGGRKLGTYSPDLVAVG
jgi:Xaa-Pro aminopeptidase